MSREAAEGDVSDAELRAGVARVLRDIISAQDPPEPKPHALIRDMPSSSRASNMPDLQQNADGTVDVWFGPKAPEGKESNWIPTKADGRFEAIFRFYGPEQPLFDKTWVLPDIEKVE